MKQMLHCLPLAIFHPILKILQDEKKVHKTKKATRLDSINLLLLLG